MTAPNEIHSLVDHLFRQESGKMVAVLTRILGLQNLEVAQDIVQDTLINALHTWKHGAIPDNPAAWLQRAARNRAIDWLRRKRKFTNEIAPEYAHILQSDFALTSAFHQVFLDSEISDSQLRMMFACCHPAIAIESQIALVLRTLGGLSISEIARAFLTGEESISKRIYRAKERIRTEGILMDVPTGDELPDRLDAVLKSIYLLFREGYHSSHPDQLIREDLCLEAMRLCLLLTGHPVTARPRSKALMALMCFQTSRLHARLDDDGHIILIKHQDRNRWYRPLIQKGFHFLEASSEPFEASPYHLEAMVASLHAAAPSFEATDWKKIHGIYRMLYKLNPNPIVAMNKAIASAYAVGFAHALEELKAIKELPHHPMYLACIGEMYLELNEPEQSKAFFREAIKHAPSSTVKTLLLEKIQAAESLEQ